MLLCVLLAAACGDEKNPNAENKALAAKTMEAMSNVKRLYDEVTVFYMGGNASASTSMTVSAPQFPAKSVGPTPPVGSCCSNGGNQCTPDASLWKDKTWDDLMFSMDTPYFYSYQYITEDPTKEFTVRAIGDLDCDGEYSTFEMTGKLTEDNPDGPTGGELKITKEHE
jgi:hypothetical protein